MENKIERYCETCKKRLLIKAAHDRCFNNNHDLRVSGHLTLNGDGIIIPQTFKEYLETVKI